MKPSASGRTNNLAEELLDISSRLSSLLANLSFSVACVYDPTHYAARPWQKYIRSYAQNKKETVFFGMNPGPWGMTQTGIPFGEISVVQNWLGIEERVERPKKEHPAKPILGFSCTRSEVSGRRFWGLIQKEFGTADRFFAKHIVLSYCPLTFIAETAQGRNITPLQLPAAERKELYRFCNAAAGKMITVLQPAYVIGIGRFAQERLRHVIAETPGLAGIPVLHIPHPSPASPLANRNWNELARRELQKAGIWQASAGPAATC